MLPKEPVEISSNFLHVQFLALCLTNLSLNRQRLRPDFLDVTSLQPQHSMATPREREVVCCNEGGELVLAMQSRDQFENCFGRVSVQVPGGLIRSSFRIDRAIASR